MCSFCLKRESLYLSWLEVGAQFLVFQWHVMWQALLCALALSYVQQHSTIPSSITEVCNVSKVTRTDSHQTSVISLVPLENRSLFSIIFILRVRAVILESSVAGVVWVGTVNESEENRNKSIVCLLVSGSQMIHVGNTTWRDEINKAQTLCSYTCLAGAQR